jgi:DNA topoisomerase-2
LGQFADHVFCITFVGDPRLLEGRRKKPKKTSIMATLSMSENDSTKGNAKPVKAAGQKTIEEVYQKMTQLEHILLRPDTYIGSTERATEEMWVLDPSGSLTFREISFVRV